MPPPPPQPPPDASSYETWDEARKLSSLVGNISSLFTTCIRFLRKDAEANSPTLSQTSKFCLQRLLNSDGFKAPVYYAAMTFKPDKISNDKYLSPGALACLFTPDELAHIIGLLYLYRRIQKGCDETEWADLSKTMHLHAEIAGHLGNSIPKIGLSWALLLGSIRHLSCGLFLGIDKKKFVQYRRNQKIKKQIFGLEEELQTFGCTHLHVASLLVQALGLGGSIPKAINSGLLFANTPEDELDTDAYRMRIAWAWIESLRNTGQAPNITHKGAYYPLKAELEKLYNTIAPVRDQGSRWSFFAKGKEDISPEKTPCLFLESARASSPPSEAVSAEPVEKEVLDQFSKENLEAEDL